MTIIIISALYFAVQSLYLPTFFNNGEEYTMACVLVEDFAQLFICLSCVTFQANMVI